LNDLPIVDSNLDLAENVTLFGRELTLKAAEIRALEKRTTRQATVSLPELERGSIAMAFATVAAGFLAMDVGETFEPRSAIYHTLGVSYPPRFEGRYSARTGCVSSDLHCRKLCNDSLDARRKAKTSAPRYSLSCRVALAYGQRQRASLARTRVSTKCTTRRPPPNSYVGLCTNRTL
jgi:hypothetical protein